MAVTNTIVEKTTVKVGYLDGIRGLAALFVVFHHFALSFYPSYFFGTGTASHLNDWDTRYGHSIFSFATNGNFFVCIFFVLSGYVLSRKYFLVNSFEMIVSAAQRRYLRLFIPVGFTLLVSYMLVITHAYYNVPVSVIAHSNWLGWQWDFNHVSPTSHLIKSLVYKVMLQGDEGFDTVTWTMSAELYGSLFVFAILALTHRTKNKLFSLLTILLACILLGKSAGYMCVFVLGITLNFVEASREKLSKFFVFIVPAILIPVGLVFGSFPSTYVLKDTVWEHLPGIQHFLNPGLHLIGSYFVVLSVVISPALQRFFSNAICRFLGYISFSLYLLHVLVIGSVGCYVFLLLQAHMSYNAAVAVVFALSLGITIILSYLMTKYVDDFGIRLSKRFYELWIKADKTDNSFGDHKTPARAEVVHYDK